MRCILSTLVRYLTQDWTRHLVDKLILPHSVSSLRISHSSAEGLKLVFVGSDGPRLPGTVFEQEQRMKFLFIVFTSPTGMLHTYCTIKCIDDKERSYH
jgi:hypothetical protein